MFTLKFTTGIRPTERNMSIARAAQIYYHKGAYAEKPEQKADQKPEVKPVEQKKPEVKPVEQKKPEVKPVEQKKPDTKADQKPEVKPVEQKKPDTKADQKPEVKPVEQKKPEPKKPADEKKPVVEEKKPEDKKPVAEQKPVAADKKQEDQKKPEQQKPEDKKSAEKPVVEVLDREGNIVAMLPGVPEEAPKAARTTGFDINNFVKPKQSKQQASNKNFGQTKSINEVYSFIRNTGVAYPFDPMPGFSVTEKVEVLKKYANFNGTHPGLDVIQLNTLIMIFNSPDLSRKMINCGLDPKQVLGVKRFNEVPANKYDNNNAYDFAFEYTLSKKKKLVLLLNSIPTYDEKQGWMSAYNITIR